MNGRLLAGLGASLTMAGIVAFGAGTVMAGAQGASISSSCAGTGRIRVRRWDTHDTPPRSSSCNPAASFPA
jgi:hypothetical protein